MLSKRFIEFNYILDSTEKLADEINLIDTLSSAWI